MPGVSLGSPWGRMWGRSSIPALAGLIAPLVVLGLAEGASLWLRLFVLAATGFAWHGLFAFSRRQALDPHVLVAAAIMAAALPMETPAWHMVLGMSLGLVIGELVFGGRGRAFLNPAVVGLTVLMFSFTDQPYRDGPDLPALTLLPALVLLLASGQVSWRILAGIGAGILLVGFAQGLAEPWLLLTQGSVLMVLLFLAPDPAASASTNPGRIAYGALAGGLTVLFAQAGPLFGASAFAVLMASTFAPLIDQAVIQLHCRLGRARHA